MDATPNESPSRHVPFLFSAMPAMPMSPSFPVKPSPFSYAALSTAATSSEDRSVAELLLSMSQQAAHSRIDNRRGPVDPVTTGRIDVSPDILSKALPPKTAMASESSHTLFSKADDGSVTSAEALQGFAKSQAKAIVMIASHECARTTIVNLTSRNVANPIAFSSLQHTATTFLCNMIRDKVDAAIMTIHRLASPSLSAQVPSLCAMIQAEVPRLYVASAKYISKDLISLGCAIDTAIKFSTGLQTLVRAQASKYSPESAQSPKSVVHHQQPFN